VLAMRFINIAMFAAGLILFRRVLQYSGASKSLINLVLLIFTFIPLETFTAAQINYDNLVFPIVAATLLFALQFVTALRRDNRFEIKPLALLIIMSILGAQVKYSYIPIALAVCGLAAFFIAGWAWTEKRDAIHKVTSSVAQLRRGTVIALATGVVISSGLFGWRYGYNLVTYRSPMPNCSRVLSVQSCMAWSPWARDYENGLHHQPAASMPQRIEFTKVWVHIMGNELFTVLNANRGGAMEEPVRQLVVISKFVIIAGLLFAALQWRRLKEMGSPLVFFVVASGFYLAVLMLKNYGDYTHYGIPTAIQARYLLPVLLPLMILIARAYSLALVKFPEWKALVVIGMLVLGSQGGGVLTYMMKTNQSWYWTATAMNAESPAQLQTTIAENNP
jgi:hypothetical protein